MELVTDREMLEACETLGFQVLYVLAKGPKEFYCFLEVPEHGQKSSPCRNFYHFLYGHAAAEAYEATKREIFGQGKLRFVSDAESLTMFIVIVDPETVFPGKLLQQSSIECEGQDEMAALLFPSTLLKKPQKPQKRKKESKKEKKTKKAKKDQDDQEEEEKEEKVEEKEESDEENVVNPYGKWIIVEALKPATQRLLDEAVQELLALPPRCWRVSRGRFVSKRLQLTVGFNYPFAGLKENPGVSYTHVPAVKAFVAHVSGTYGLPADRVMVHVNDYPQDTGSGLVFHQDNEKEIDQAWPILGYNWGGSARLLLQLPGQEEKHVDVVAGFCYVMRAGYQSAGTHAIARTRKHEKAGRRVSLTLRVVNLANTRPAPEELC